MLLIFFTLNNEILTRWKIRYPFTDKFDSYYTAYY